MFWWLTLSPDGNSVGRDGDNGSKRNKSGEVLHSDSATLDPTSSAAGTHSTYAPLNSRRRPRQAHPTRLPR